MLSTGMSSIRKSTKLASNSYSSLLVISTLLLIFGCKIDTSFAIQCYKCTVVPDVNIINDVKVITPSCTKFDESDQYVVDCEYSTMCLKTISTIYLQNGEKKETVTRGCAQQKETTQVFRNRQWEQQHTVLEVYKEGCTDHGENYLGASINTQCYCRAELCNSGPRQMPTHLLLVAVTVICLLFSHVKKEI